MKIVKIIRKSLQLRLQSRLISFEGSPRGIPRENPKNFREMYDRFITSQRNLPKALKLSFQDYIKELKEKLSTDMFIDHLSYKYFAQFRKMRENELDMWSVTTDSGIQGLSTASLVKHPDRGTAIFSGNLDTTVAKTGDIARSGMVNFRSPHRIIFGSVRDISFYPYNSFIIKFRGDGRTYSLNFQMNYQFDFTWHDQYMSPLFTRGGPYWQIAKIPFHKFYLTSKGRIQDNQEPFNRRFIRHISVSLMDQISGPFHFEVDYMALSKEHFYNETFSYELYNTPSRGHSHK